MLTTTLPWTFDHMGLAGESGWAKSLKQFTVLVFFAVAMLAVHDRVVQARASQWDTFERVASVGLAIAIGVALVQALGFVVGLPGAEALGRLTSSNPSIAAGSEELYLGHRFVGIPRLRGPMPEPLLFGSYLLAAVPVTAAAAMAHRGWERNWRAAVAFLGLLALVGTFSRGAWLGAAATGILLALGVLRGGLGRPHPRTVVFVGLPGLVLLGLGVALLTGLAPWELPGLVLDRLTQSTAGHDMSNLTRFWAWEAAGRMFVDHPLAGVGWGAFGLHFYAVAPAGAEAAHFGWPVTNNLPLMVLAESGSIGLGLWVWALLPALRALGPGRFSKTSYVLAAASAGVLVQSLTFSQWNLPHLWLLLAFSTAMRNNELVRDLQGGSDG
jgi:O-antigen ligase